MLARLQDTLALLIESIGSVRRRRAKFPTGNHPFSELFRVESDPIVPAMSRGTRIEWQETVV